ncbi:MAG TPA: SDR family NAD(P)-dependent oxidoreductase [Verrucomicrobiae bacterium]|nr:SDR family NAD(P)-dependent oxidoreductase [Verrucomicrobiae bacterium]
MGVIENKIAIITGGGGGIGGAVAARFVKEGARVAVADIDANAARTRVAALAATGSDVIAVETDVPLKRSVLAMVQLVLDRWGRIDILVTDENR